MVNALSVNLEDYFQVSGFEKYINRREWGSLPSRIVRNTKWVLEHINQEERCVGCFYFHPWEIDTEQPRSWPGGGGLVETRHLALQDGKELRRLLGDFEFAPRGELLRTLGGDSVRTEYNKEDIDCN